MISRKQYITLLFIKKNWHVSKIRDKHWKTFNLNERIEIKTIFPLKTIIPHK